MEWVIAAVILVVLLGFALAYNLFVSLDQARQQAQGDVAAQLSQRWDVVAQMAALVSRYMGHESDLQQALTRVRGERQDSEGADIRATMAGFFARAEAYPDLRADATFVRMQQAVEEAETQLAAARRALNSATARYNNAVRQFPLNIAAAIFGFRAASFVNASEDVSGRPELSNF